jgi:hypothetical protein
VIAASQYVPSVFGAFQTPPDWTDMVLNEAREFMISVSLLPIQTPEHRQDKSVPRIKIANTLIIIFTLIKPP